MLVEDIQDIIEEKLIESDMTHNFWFSFSTIF